MIRKLRGTTVVITGATSGIGRETALEFVRAGARVVDAQAINFFNTLVPGLVDIALGWSVPFIEGMRRGTSSSTEGRGNLYNSASKGKP